MPTLKDIQKQGKIGFRKLWGNITKDTQHLTTEKIEDFLHQQTTLAFQAGEKSKEDMVLEEIEERLGGFEDTTFEPQHKEYNDGYNQALSSLKEKIISDNQK
jgi:hypothetical protein